MLKHIIIILVIIALAVALSLLGTNGLLMSFLVAFGLLSIVAILLVVGMSRRKRAKPPTSKD